jgi:hypothetical protein
MRISLIILLLISAIGSAAAVSEPDRIVTFGDVHGGATELVALLKALDLIDAGGDWTGGQTHLISLGDLLDRGPESRRVMDLLMHLEAQAPETGGRVSVVLGNHELMNLTGDLRYVADEEYAAFAPDEDPEERQAALAAFLAASPDLEDAGVVFASNHPPGFFGHRAAFQADGRYGEWLLNKPQILVVDGIAFVHGGLSAHFTAETIDDFNAAASAEIRELLTLGEGLVAEGVLPGWDDFLTAEPLAAEILLPDALLKLRESMTFAEDGPSWYRGTADCHALIEAPRFEAVLAAADLQRVVMGHTPTSPRIVQGRFDDRAILADTGMYTSYYRGRPSAVIFEGGSMVALTLTEDDTLTPRFGRTPGDIRASDESSLNRQLVEQAGAHAIRPDTPFEIEIDGRTYLATFRRGSRREQQARLAAHALDKHLGLGLVAPIVVYANDGRKGTLEAHPARIISEADRATSAIGRPNSCAGGSDYQLMYALDALMGNGRRTGESILYDATTWLMYLTGHDASFPTSTNLPAYLEGVSSGLPVALKNKLARLDRNGLEELLGEFLSSRQLKALIERRDQILATWPAEE